MQRPIVSVIIPLYEKAEHIQRALDSLHAQTFHDFEWIVVDDGSTDGGPLIVEKNLDRRGRLLRQPNAGPGAARNTGWRAACGKYFAFLDADDEWRPEFLARAVEILERSPEAASVSCGYVELPSGAHPRELWRRRGLREGLFRLTPQTSGAQGIHAIAYMSPWSTVARAEIVQHHGGFFDRDRCLFGEDGFLWMKILLRHPVYFHHEPLALYHREASALAGNLQGPREVEPILRYPEDLRATCPPELGETLERMLAWRAARTACMLGYWGKWREARALLRQFPATTRVSWKHRLAASACATPVAATAGAAWRWAYPEPAKRAG